jgi:chromosome segregation ATPase
VEPPALRRSLFGYSAKSVRRALAATDSPAMADEEPRPPDLLVEDLQDLEEELETAYADLAEQTEARRGAETRAREAAARTEVAEARNRELGSDLQRAAEDLERREQELRTSEARTASLEPKLAVLRSALTREIQNVWAAEMRAHEVGNELARAREDVRDARRETVVAEGRAVAAEARAAQAEDDAARKNERWSSEGLSPVFEAAEHAFVDIVEEARRRGEDELAELEAKSERARDELEQLRMWRERVAPLIAPLQASLEEAREEAEQVGGRIRDAVEPMTTAATMLIAELTDLAAMTADVSRGPVAGEEASGGADAPGTDGPQPGDADLVIDLSDEEHPSTTR